MKTAILISGHMRSFERCLPTLHWHVFRHYPDADFFVSTIKDADSDKAKLLNARYPSSRVSIDVVDEQPDCVAEMRAKGVELPKEWTPGAHYMHEPYAISVRPQAVLRQLWQMERVWKMADESGEGYSVFIRCRPDLYFHSYEDVFGIEDETALLPWWGKFGGVNDRFACLGVKAARAYFTTYSQIPGLMADGCPLHPESLVRASLDEAKAYRLPLKAEFSTLRANGEMRHPEISMIDLAHAGLSHL